VVAAGVGWLYLIREAGILVLGPRVRGALPLEQLARADGQALARLLLAWIPAGIAGGLVVAARTRLGAAAQVAVIAWLLLFVAGALSDAVADSTPVADHLGDQLTRPGTLVAVGLIAAGALLVPPTARRGRAAGAAG
jgi:hypothetical protein